jgi:hypothetical protein
MQLDQMLAALQEDASYAEHLLPHWDESMACLPAGVPDFLTPEKLAEYREWSGFDAVVEPALMETARRIADNSALKAFVWHLYRRLVMHPDSGGFDKWPGLDRSLGEYGKVPYLMAGMAIVPIVRDKHRAMGVDEQVTRDTLTQLRAFCDAFRNGWGMWGLYPRVLGWVRHYVFCRLFRVGRFEYKIEPAHALVEAYRHRSTGNVVALAKDGVKFNDRGYIDADNPDGAVWTSKLIKEDGRVSGTVVSPWGKSVNQSVTLDLKDWRLALGQGDVILDMHIPTGGKMTPEASLDSFQRGFEFFARHFPDKHPAAVGCSSWIFSPLLEELLPPDANMVKLNREIYLFPTPSWGKDGLFHVLFGRDDDLATAPRTTSVQRAILDFIDGGGRWRAGGMLILKDDLGRFGSQVYRSQWRDPRTPPAVAG